MRFKGLDLNLLIALDVLLDEQSVSRAAERLHVSQPAMSAALMRMREYFGDPLLKLHGKRMIPTAHAMRIQPKLKSLLGDIDILVSQSSAFDPATSDRRFRMGVSDYLLAVLFPSLVAELETAAPGVSLECTPPTDTLVAQLNQGALDCIITPENHISADHPAELLFEEDYVVVGCARNEALKGGMLDRRDFFKAGHIVVELGLLRPMSYAEFHLQKLGRQRKIDMRVASFLIAPELVINTSRITVMQRRLADYFRSRLPIAVAEMPVRIPKMREMIQYHQTRADDPALKWLIQRLRVHAGHSPARRSRKNHK